MRKIAVGSNKTLKELKVVQQLVSAFTGTGSNKTLKELKDNLLELSRKARSEVPIRL